MLLESFEETSKQFYKNLCQLRYFRGMLRKFYDTKLLVNFGEILRKYSENYKEIFIKFGRNTIKIKAEGNLWKKGW